MSKRPPEDHPILSEILRQLGEVLSPEEARDVADSVFSEALQDVFSGFGSPDAPEMSVVEGGGHMEEDSVVESKDLVRPRLQVVDSEPLLKDENLSNVQVRVLSPADLLSGVHGVFGGPMSTSQKGVQERSKPGLIHLNEGATQPLAIRQTIQSYRVTCENGLCHLLVDDVQYVLMTGQSIDVEGKRLSVEGIQETTGWFQSLQ